MLAPTQQPNKPNQSKYTPKPRAELIVSNSVCSLAPGQKMYIVRAGRLDDSDEYSLWSQVNPVVGMETRTTNHYVSHQPKGDYLRSGATHLEMLDNGWTFVRQDVETGLLVLEHANEICGTDDHSYDSMISTLDDSEFPPSEEYRIVSNGEPSAEMKNRITDAVKSLIPPNLSLQP